MSWQFLIGLSVFLYSFSALLQKKIITGKNNDPVSFSILYQLGVAVITFIIVSIFYGIKMPSMSGVLGGVVIMTALYALSNILIFKSLKTTDASKFTIIFSGRTLFAIIASSIFLQENLTGNQWIGSILIIIGIAIITIKSLKQKISVGDMYALLAAVCFGLANTNDRVLLKLFDPYTYVILSFLLPGIAVAIFNPNKIAGIRNYLNKKVIYKIVLLCSLYGISATAFFAALQLTTNSSQLFAISSFGAVLTVLLAIFILKEKDDIPKKLVGAVVSVIGLLLVNI